MTASEGVKQAMVGFYERFSGSDPGAFGEFISTDADAWVIGTDWGQWEIGHDRWIAAFETQMEQMPGLKLQAGDRLMGYEEGSIGWAADQPSLVLPDGTEVPLRLTAVFRREGGGWKIVTAHFSFGVPDAKLEELLPQLLS